VEFILDLGCGDGRITDLISSQYRVMGADFAFPTLKNIGTPTVCVDIAHLAFKANAFDIVMLTEVLEHLSDEVFRQAIEQIRRVSKKYILITVPYRENLRSGLIKCNECGTVFHIWHHHRSFKNKNELADIFPGYIPIRYDLLGPARTYKSNFISFIKQNLGHRWHKAGKSTICPQCGNKDFPEAQKNLISLICSGIEFALGKIVPKLHKRWLCVVYVKAGEEKGG
jgi:SAM-dependent methyltransferase